MILANSHKLKGRCVAGIDLDTRSWVRPLGSLDGGALASDECVAPTPNGPVEVSPGDVVEMSDGTFSNSSHHPEDINASRPLRIVDQMTPLAIQEQFRDLITVEAPLLGLRGRDVSLATLIGAERSASLQLARCSAARLYWQQRPGRRRQLRAAVTLIDTEEDLALTDPRIETLMAKRQESKLDRCLLTVSLSEPYERNEGQLWCSKLIAAALPLR